MLCRCNRPIEPKRLEVGLTTCLVCGDEDAKKEIALKQTRVGAVYNKGAPQYLGNPEEAKQTLLEGGGRKYVPIQYSTTTATTNSPQKSKLSSSKGQKQTQPPKRGRVVGVGWSNGERRYIFEHEDRTKLGIRRFVPLK